MSIVLENMLDFIIINGIQIRETVFTDTFAITVTDLIFTRLLSKTIILVIKTNINKDKRRKYNKNKEN